MEKFSYSKLDTYIQCPFKYKLIYVEKHRVDDHSIAAEFGSLVHSVEETIGKCIINNEKIDYEVLKNMFIEKSDYLKQKYGDEYFTKNKVNLDYADKTRLYLTKGIYRLEKFMKDNPDLKIVDVEKHFEVEYNGKIIFNGFIDRVLKNTKTNEYQIEDIKTYSEPLGKDQLTTPLQFVFYSLAAKELYGVKEESLSFYYDLPLCDVRQRAGTWGFQGRGDKKITKTLESIDSGSYAPRPSPLCAWCVYSKTFPNQPDGAKNLCPYYCKWTREKKDYNSRFEWQGEENHQRILEEFIKQETNHKKKSLFEDKIATKRTILRIRK